MDIINACISAIGGFLNSILGLMPRTPFSQETINGIIAPLSPYLGSLNWLIPIPTLVGILLAWCTAIGTYYIVSLGLRWIKAIQ